VPLAAIPGGFAPGVLKSAALNAGLEVGRQLFVQKLADQSVTSSTTYVDDTELYGNVVAGCTYRFTLEAVTSAHASGGMKVKFTMPSGASIVTSSFIGQFWGSFQNAVCGADGELTYIDGTGSDIPFLLYGILAVGGTAGDFQVQWSQNASYATATKMLAGSALTLVRVS
jgi:hypothetical protein